MHIFNKIGAFIPTPKKLTADPQKIPTPKKLTTDPQKIPTPKKLTTDPQQCDPRPPARKN